jgi:hypothetical protein
MPVREIIAATTSAVASEAFNVVNIATITTTALGAGETVNIQITHDGITWQDLFIQDVQQIITNTNNAATVAEPGKFRVSKSVTVSATSVNIWT